MGFMNDTLDYMKTDPYFRHGNHDKMTFSMHYAFSENFILAYSHDEVVHGKASLIGKMSGGYHAKFASLRTLMAWLFAHPGKKLMFMGDEFAQFTEWNYKSELDWMLLDYDMHRGMREWVAALNKVYSKRLALHAADDGWDGFMWLNVEDRANSVFAFMRSHAPVDGGDAERVVCVLSFTPVAHRSYDVALPEPGTLSLMLNSNDERYGGPFVPGSGEGEGDAAASDAGSGAAADASASASADAPARAAAQAAAPAKKRAKARKRHLNGLDYSATLSIPPLCALYYRYTVATPVQTDSIDDTITIDRNTKAT
jgi:1,4-alpha-glucan branching enzyme